MEKRQMVESKGIEMYRFQNEGEELSGHLLKIGKVKIEDKEQREQIIAREFKGDVSKVPAGYEFPEKEVIQGIICSEDGQVTTFLMTYDLQRKLWKKHIGRFVVIRYETTKTIPGQKQPMGIFKVTNSTEVELDEKQCAEKMEDAGMFAATNDDVTF